MLKNASASDGAPLSSRCDQPIGGSRRREGSWGRIRHDHEAHRHGNRDATCGTAGTAPASATGVRTRLEVSTTEVQRDWVDHLDKLGLDRALFRYQGAMNHNEAGASAIARFKEDRDFIKFFLDAVFDPAELVGLDREFDEVADKVRRFPEYERRLRFEQAALDELEPFVRLVAALAAARAEAQVA